MLKKGKILSTTSLAISQSDQVVSFLQPSTLDQALSIAEALSRSTFIPKSYQGNPSNILVAMQMGSEIGLGPLQSLQSICVINNQPSLYGDALMALVQGSALCEWFCEGFDEESQCGWARTKRRGRKETEQIFTMDMARRAGLAEKSGPWKQYPERMCKLKARNWLCRDVYPDVLRGFSRLNVVERDLVEEKPVSGVLEPDSPHDNRPAIEVTKAPDSVDNMAVKEIIQSMASAVNEEDMKAIKRDIRSLPESVIESAGLVSMWKTRVSQLREQKPG